jgi:hypothetical protein
MPPVQKEPNRGEELDIGAFREAKIRLLQLLAGSRGPLTRAKIMDRFKASSTYVAKLVGYSDLDKRAAFERSRDGGATPDRPFSPSLLTLGFVHEYTLQVPEDGINELVVEITQAGREALKVLAVE